jgi:hypothetical protein
MMHVARFGAIVKRMKNTFLALWIILVLSAPSVSRASVIGPPRDETEDLFGGAYWIDIPNKKLPQLEARCLSLARMPVREVRKRIVTYLSSHSRGADDTDLMALDRRMINVGVLTRLMFAAEMPRLRARWFGPNNMAGQRPWYRKAGVWHLRPNLYVHVFAGTGLNSLAEFDAAWALKSKRRTEAKSRRVFE